MTAYEMAKLYYPRLWSIKRIESLYQAGKLTKKERDDIIGANK
jgi:hypothetical protein